MDIRVLEPGDGVLLQCAQAWARPHLDLSVGRCEELIGQPQNCFVAALMDGEPVGLAVGYILERFDCNKLFLYEIDTHPDRLRRGAASGMLETLKDHCRRRGLEEIFVVTNEGNAAAMGLYAKTGGKRPAKDDVVFVYDFTR
jgi:ribosomal protein S18 acetylase RimI-like enzyme